MKAYFNIFGDLIIYDENTDKMWRLKWEVIKSKVLFRIPRGLTGGLAVPYHNLPLEEVKEDMDEDEKEEV